MLSETTIDRSRKELIRLIKNLPENHIPMVKTFVEFIKHEHGNPTLQEFLASVPKKKRN